MLYLIEILSEHNINNIASSIEIPELEPCAICNEEIFLHLLKKSFTILTCGHVFHCLCLENIRENLLICPGKNCVAEIEIVEKSPLIQKLSHRSMSIDEPQEKLFAEEDSNNNQSQNMESDIPGTSTTSTLPSKRISHPTSADKHSSKKAKKQSKKEESPILKKLIEELLTTAPEIPEEVIEVDENTNNFLYHYSKISHAESKHEIANKEVIECYYDLGVAIKKRFDHYRNLNHGERVCLALVNDEIRKQIPDDITNDALKKRKERARKIYDLFFSIGREKIRAVKMFSASIISNLSQDNIDYVIVEILKKRGIVT
ncbi:12240_t:CDS:2 [Entrophospora sp. SA101]|nr:12240_t:CDS:2 [Entrophospora sp. SA101]